MMTDSWACKTACRPERAKDLLFKLPSPGLHALRARRGPDVLPGRVMWTGVAPRATLHRAHHILILCITEVMTSLQARSALVIFSIGAAAACSKPAKPFAPPPAQVGI